LFLVEEISFLKKKFEFKYIIPNFSSFFVQKFPHYDPYRKVPRNPI
jgi:hypothetical protein